MKNIRGASPIIRIVCLSFALLSITACGNTSAATEPEKSEKNFTLKDWLCLYAPDRCEGEAMRQIYLAPPDAKFEVTLNGKLLRIPMSYVHASVMAGTDFSHPLKPDTSIYLEALAPDIVPRTTQNLKYFLSEPNTYNVVTFDLLTGGSSQSGKPVWLQSVDRIIQNVKNNQYDSPIRHPNQYGLEAWGTDYKKRPDYIPCNFPYPKEKQAVCDKRPPDFAYRPLKPNGSPSAMVCNPGEDIAERLMAASENERPALQKTLNKSPSAPYYPHCRHVMIYEPLNALITIHYRSGFLPQWKKIEDGIRAALDSFVVPQAELKQ